MGRLWQKRLGESAASDQDRGSVYRLVVLIHLWFVATAGFLKFVGMLVGFPYIHLISKILMLVVMLSTFISLRLNSRQVVIFLVFGGYLVISLLQNPYPQVLMGFWVLMPFLYGALFPQEVLSLWLIRKLRWLLVALVAFQFINYFMTFPWEGMTIEFGSVKSLAGREWSDGGARRLAGLSSSSIESSLLIALVALIVAGSQRVGWVRALLIAVSAFAIYLGTMKTAAVAFVICSIPIVIRFSVVRKGLIGSVLGVLMVGVTLPYYLYFRAGYIVGDGEFESLYDRFTVVWPAVIEFALDRGSVLVGLGLGGLGAAMQLGREFFSYSFVDNLYLYLVLSSGLLGVVVIAMILWCLLRLSHFDRDGFIGKGGCLILFFVVYGLTQVPLESSGASVFLGASLFAIAFASAPKRLRFIC